MLILSKEDMHTGMRIDYSNLLQDIRRSIEANSFMQPAELERRLYILQCNNKKFKSEKVKMILRLRQMITYHIITDVRIIISKM